MKVTVDKALIEQVIDELMGRVDSLCHACETYADPTRKRQALEAELTRLLYRLEAAEKDAARYQYFRRGNRFTVKCKSATVIFGPNTERDYPDQLDAAIDAAMGEQT